MDVPPDDGFKWFGEGFDGFPKRLPDDCVEYVLYVVDKKLKDISALRTRLNQILKTAKDLKKDLLKDYIWQRDSFDFGLENGNVAGTLGPDATKLPHLKGSINFGDSIADEWLTVYLLLELSKKCPDAWIRVYDTDGEFLLIEAANALPKWLNPDTANNRVWISNGHLRLIPITPGSQSKNLSLQDASQFILEKQSKLLISPFVEDEAFHRLKGYPAAISNSLHHALIQIPRNLAYLLHTRPATISPAIEAFYLRDPIALKPLATKNPSTLTFPPTDLVTTSVTFTKVGYAQLQGQLFPPPRAWTANPSTKDLDYDDPKVSVGMKLTCGFEMLVRDPQNRDKAVVRELEVLLSDLSSGEVTLPTDEEIKSWPQTQDDDAWLDINYEDFENELSGDKSRKADVKSKEDGTSKDGTGIDGSGKAQENLRNMVSRFESFMNDEDAGIDGADDFDHEDGASDADDDEDTDTDSDGEDKSASYTDAEFEQAMREMMGMPAEEKEKRGLVEEARRLALEDEEAGGSEEGDEDEDEEMKKVMEAMERELKDRGALKESTGKGKGKATAESRNARTEAAPAVQKPQFGPPRPPGTTTDLPASSTAAPTEKGKSRVSFADEANGSEDSEVESLPEELYGTGEHELSSDEEDHNDVDLNFAKNMLEGLKGQAGMQGPAGNLMKALGVSMPRDEGDRIKALDGGQGKGRGSGSAKGVVNEDGVRRLR